MTDDTTTPPAEATGASEVFDSVNRFDEIAIARAFGEDIYVLKEKPFDFLRAMAFVVMRRDGATDAEAKERAFLLGTRQARDFFAPDVEEFDPEEPVTEAGKDDSPSA